MKNLFSSSKLLIAIGGVSVALVLGFSLLGQSLASKQSGLYQLSNGLGICFQRVNQSFTALMIKDFSSDFMSKNFKATTGECFSELSNAFTSKALMTGAIRTKLDNIMSDSHWFSEKTDRLVRLSQREDINLSESNIIGKYIEIEQLKVSLDEVILQKAKELGSGNQLLLVALVLSQLLLCASFFYLFLKRRIVSKDLNKIESEIKLTKIGARDSHLVVQKVLKKLFTALEVPNTHAFVSSYHQSVLEENYKLNDHLVKVNAIGALDIAPSNKEESENILAFDPVDFNHSFSAVIDKVKDKAFNHGVIIDTNIVDQFMVRSEAESLNQLLFSILNFSLESSLAHNEGRKIEIKGKPLGGIAYCKFKIAGFCFNDEDLAVINGKKASNDTDLNLVILKELTSDANVGLSVKNKHNSELNVNESEIELIFERALGVEAKKPTSKIVKGSKREIRRFLDKNLTM